MESNVAHYVDDNLDIDHVKMQLCKPFKTIVENCSIPMTECIENIAIKEIVIAEVLKKMVVDSKRTMEIVKNATRPDILESFSYNDCVIFGGMVARAPSQSATLGHLVGTVLGVYLLIVHASQ